MPANRSRRVRSYPLLYPLASGSKNAALNTWYTTTPTITKHTSLFCGHRLCQNSNGLRGINRRAGAPTRVDPHPPALNGGPVERAGAEPQPALPCPWAPTSTSAHARQVSSSLAVTAASDRTEDEGRELSPGGAAAGGHTFGDEALGSVRHVGAEQPGLQRRWGVLATRARAYLLHRGLHIEH